MDFFSLRERILVEGSMPERALLRLKRAGIDVYNAKKPQKNQILFSVKKKDVEKVFAIYPKVCYNRNGYSPYAVRSLGAVGVGRYLEKAKNRVGFLLGALLFCGVILYCDQMVFGVEFVGSEVYAREAVAALEEYGIKAFSLYKKGKEDLVSAKLLSLDGMEFCSVKKTGAYVRVEMRVGEFSEKKEAHGDMKANREGTLLSLTVLKGTAQKRVGDFVKQGETLVGGWFAPEGGEQVRVQPIARACIACVYEAAFEAEDAQAAFAKGYLALEIGENDKITQTSVTETDGLYLVRIEYTAIETVNF